MPIWAKLITTVVLIIGISEVTKKNEQIGALITALPWIALLSLIWLKIENQSVDKISNYSALTFWYVVPTLPMFLLIPKLLSMGINFWLALLCGIISTILILLMVSSVALKFGIKLL